MDERFDLGRDIVSIVDEVMETGHYASRDDVLRAGVKLVQERERKRAELAALLQEGLDDIKAGRIHDLEDVFRELDEELAELARRRSA